MIDSKIASPKYNNHYGRVKERSANFFIREGEVVENLDMFCRASRLRRQYGGPCQWKD